MKPYLLTFLFISIILMSCQQENAKSEKDPIAQSEIPPVTMCDGESAKKDTISR